jgi:Tannase and feruloyl esterase
MVTRNSKLRTCVAVLVLFGCSLRILAAEPKTPSAADSVSERCVHLAAIKMSDVTIQSAGIQAANEAVTGANLPSMTGTPGGGAPVKGLPSFCRVTGSMHPSADSDIRFEVWMPEAGWDGRFNGANSGGLAGYINYNDLAAGIRAGQATAGSDVGHEASPGDGAWAKGHPQKVRDYGWRGVHLTAVVGKKLVAALYGRGPDHSYFIGCSNGGRQALVEASRFPEDYDGIVAGAPAASLIDVAASMVNVIQAQMPAGAAIRPDQAQLLQSEVVKQCDALDGQSDGLIADPRQCKLDTSKLACSATDSKQCFTSTQIKALEQIYAGVHDKSGRRVAFGYPPGGAEVGNPVAQFGWDGNILAKFQSVSGGTTLSEAILTDLAQPAIATDASFDFDRDPARLKAALGAELDAQPNLTRFFARGGKLIIWHGWADPILPPEPTVAFYEAVLQHSGAKARDGMRLFMVPGVQHCVGGTGPDAIGQIGAPLPGEKPEQSLGAAVQSWVETSRAPDSLVGRRGMIMMAMHPDAPQRQRLICAYPSRAILRTDADPDKADSYTCQAPAGDRKH